MSPSSALVVDANVLITLTALDGRAEPVEAWFDEVRKTGQTLHSPELCRFEVASGLTREIASGRLPQETLAEAWAATQDLPIRYHPMHRGDRAVEIALTLKRASAYDAAYLALAERLEAKLVTLDGKLYRNASQSGYPVEMLPEQPG